MMINRIKKCIEEKIDAGFNEFIIYPYGDLGMQVKKVLNESYGRKERYIIDKHLSKYNKNIVKPDILENIDCSKMAIIIATNRAGIYEEIKAVCDKFFEEVQIGKIFEYSSEKKNVQKKNIQYTKKGKYSCGPLCNHLLVESCGAFCSFALGTDVVRNHPTQYVSTHPFLYYSGINDDLDRMNGKYRYEDYEGEEWYFADVNPGGVYEKAIG